MLEDKVSIILPVYNAGKTIERTIQSVLNQTYKKIELIIINNGSQDDTEEICSKYLKNNSEIIKYKEIKTPNVSKARNEGITISTGKYLAFIDADDQFIDVSIEKLVKNANTTNAQIVTSGYKTLQTQKRYLIEQPKDIENTTDIKKYLETLKENYLFNELWNKLYITSIIKENNIIFNEEFELGEDFIFNIDYIGYVSKAVYINEPLYIYTESETGLKKKYRKDKFEIEYKLTKYLENFYIKQKYPLEYIYNRYARVYMNGIMNIYHKNNCISKKEKNKQLKEFVNSEQYKKDIQQLKQNVTDKKFKIAIQKFFSKGIFRIKIFIRLNNLRK